MSTFQNDILITGAAGFLGSAIVRQAVDSGMSVTATDKDMPATPLGVNFITADVLDPDCLSVALKGVRCVCHAAGLAHIYHNSKALAARFHSVNVVGTQNLATAAIRAGISHFVFISSVSVYGAQARGKDEDTECYPDSPYAKSKLMAERCLMAICQNAGIKLTILRFGTLYGEGDRGNVARLIKSIAHAPFIWVGTGENLKSLLYLEDAARACIAVIKKPASGIKIYNVSGYPSTMQDIVTAIAQNLQKSIPRWHIPAHFALNLAMLMKCLSFSRGPARALHDALQKWLADDYCSAHRFCRAFDFYTRIGLDEGMRREVEWLRSIHAWK